LELLERIIRELLSIIGSSLHRSYIAKKNMAQLFKKVGHDPCKMDCGKNLKVAAKNSHDGGCLKTKLIDQ